MARTALWPHAPRDEERWRLRLGSAALGDEIPSAVSEDAIALMPVPSR
jgi:hypothetical protein